jgi:hypothetical protein
MDIEAVQNQIERLCRTAETGEDWAEICRLEADIENYDPSPWCQYCGAKRERDCDCGPIAENN